MSGPTFTLPPQILDMLAKGFREMDQGRWEITSIDNDEEPAHVAQVSILTDQGDRILFLRGQDMGRT